MGTPKDSEKTREKLIDAAGRLFAKKGLNGVTVRDIVQEAKTPVSAINYHFGSKDALYREVLLEACKIDLIPEEEQEELLGMEPTAALFILVDETLKQYRSKGSANWQTMVLTKECLNPGPVFQEIADKYWGPELGFLCKIIGKIAGKPESDKDVRFAALTLIGLTDIFGIYGKLLESVTPGLMDELEKASNLSIKITELVIQAADGKKGKLRKSWLDFI